MTDFLHGVRVTEITEGIRPIRTIDTAIIGIVATANDADAQVFPLNKPVLIADIAGYIGKAGKNGTLSKALNAILKQANAMTVVVRVEEDSDGQDAKVIGEYASGQYTGAKALLTAQNTLQVTPRILGAPGLDSESVTKELISIAQKTRSFVYAHAVADTKEEAATYAQKFSQREVMLMWGDWQGFDETTKQVGKIDSVATALGLRAKLDNEIGWHKSLSNVGVNGVMGCEKQISFSVSDPANDANYLNSKNITALVHNRGYRYWGNRTPSEEPKFSFECYTRTAQVLADTMEEAHVWAVDKPLTPGLVGDIVMGIRAKLRELTSYGYLLGGDAWFDPKLNTKELLAEGKLAISYDYTPVPPLEFLNLRQHITDTYLIDFGRRVEAAQAGN